MINDSEVEDFLEHFGVKGQKWGVRQNTKKFNNKKLTNKEVNQKVAAFLKSHPDGQTHVSQLRKRKSSKKFNNKKLTNKEVNQKVAAFLKRHPSGLSY